MFDFLVDTMLVVFSENIGQQTVCIPMRTDWALLFADLFLHFYETDYIQALLSKIGIIPDFQSEILTSLWDYFEKVFQSNNHVSDHLPLIHVYQSELRIKSTVNTIRSLSYLDL